MRPSDVTAAAVVRSVVYGMFYLPRSTKTISSSVSTIRVSGCVSFSISKKSMILDVSWKQAWLSSKQNVSVPVLMLLT